MFFSDYYVLSLDLHGAQLIRCKRGIAMLGIQPEIVQKWVTATSQQLAGNPSTEGYPWSECLGAAQSLMQQIPATAALKVVLSNQFVRYKVLPAFPPLTSADESAMMAKQAFIEVFGDVVEQWRVAVNPFPHGESVFISAIDEALYVALNTMADSYNIKLISVQPYLMASFNTMHKAVRAQYACFLQVEVGRVTLAMIRDQAWENVSSQLVQANSEEQIIGLVKREMILAGWPEHTSPTIYIATLNTNTQFSPARLTSSLGTLQWPVEKVNALLPKGSLPEQDHPHALAIAGVR